MQTLWATTKLGRHKIKIYVDTEINGFWAWTDWSQPEAGSPTVAIRLHPMAFRNPERLDETLMHEFIHAIEFLKAGELKRKGLKNCTPAARVFGKYLPRMLKALVQEGLPIVGRAAHKASSKPRR